MFYVEYTEHRERKALNLAMCQTIETQVTQRRFIMRILFVIFASLLLISVVGCGDGGDETYETGSSPLILSWHALEQSERNQKILRVALDDYGDNVGESCKEWVRDVIEEATDGHVVILSNNESGDSWEPDPEGHVIRYRHNTNPALLNTTPGDIVQMQWNAGVGSSDSEYNMHTAIVLSVFPNGVIFIESNYDKTPKNVEDAVVGIRFVSEEEFQKQVQAFSVYSIH